ncbi:MAG: amino acid ABC transporter substrate-binding protein [Okeania sp. SIO3B5]|uniref:amino acid ABC transporter substrate-binding protein n=1 Tax=Okeania sp. SIO3B5 TaxID=2607811 RepID=UPI001401AD5F|nr:amino acid ABC transporter substrate-binding protein [Okeania sp. SIO3B5]NEO56211.1 amino acid ABC transporter substrate-binding protein [Okeania sp. SIO3B5]
MWIYFDNQLKQCRSQNNLPQKTSTQPPNTSEDKSILEQVMERGKLNCGVYGNLPGFSHVSKIDMTQGNFEEQKQENTSGFDVDICKAIAAAIFDNSEAVKYEYLSSEGRFKSKVDVLSRNTTWTVERDISYKDKDIEFGPIVFYDGQGILVRKNSEVASLNDLNDQTICVKKGTTSEENLVDEMKKRELRFEIKSLQSQNEVYKLYKQGECQAVTSDKSQLAGILKAQDNPNEHTILSETLSKEPLAPAVIDSDQQWVEIVRWVVFALIEAEELGINQNNLEEMKDSKDPKIRRFLGLEKQEKNIGSLLGLEPDYTQRIIRHVGNYGEIYDRHFGPNYSTPIERGLNKLWNKGGLIYSPPFR